MIFEALEIAIFYYFGSEKVQRANQGAHTNSGVGVVSGEIMPNRPTQSSPGLALVELWPALQPEHPGEAVLATSPHMRLSSCYGLPMPGRIGQQGCFGNAGQSQLLSRTNRLRTDQLEERKEISSTPLSFSLSHPRRQVNANEKHAIDNETMASEQGNGTPIAYDVTCSPSSVYSTGNIEPTTPKTWAQLASESILETSA